MRWTGRRRAGHARALLALLALAAPACAGRDATERAAATDPACAEIERLQGAAREEVAAIARLLAKRPSMAIDFSATSGEYCLDTGGPVMAHFTTRPNESKEDIVFFVEAAPLVAKGLRIQEFPVLDPTLGQMQPNAWYRYEGQGTEPHHGMEMGGRTWLMLAVDVN